MSLPRVLASVALAAAFGTALSPVVGDMGVAEAAGSCSTTPSAINVSPDTTLQNLFINYGNASIGWTGGDGTYSAALPDGRELWLFSDTFLGVVHNGKRNRARTPYLHNSFVVENAQGQITQTLYTTTTKKPSAYIDTTSKNPIKFGFWPGATVVSGQTLYVSLAEYTFGQSPFSFKRIHNFVAEFNLPTLQLTGMVQLPDGPINWAIWMLQDSGNLYVYGSQGNFLYVAMVPGSNPLGPWSFYDGSGWSSDASQAVPIANFGNGGSVTVVNGTYVLITMGDSSNSNQTMEASFSCSPTGPFVNDTAIFVAHDGAQYPAKWGVRAHDAHAHPELSPDPNTLIVSYDVNGPGSRAAESTASVYRPRFLSVSFTF